MKDHII